MTTVEEMTGFILLRDEHDFVFNTENKKFGEYVITNSIGAMTITTTNYTKAGVKLPTNSKKPAFLLKENHSITKVRR